MVSNPKRHLVRTVMCRNAEAGIYCKHREERGDCWFAHQECELRCRAFARYGDCSDPRCNRIHAPVDGCPLVVETGRRPHGGARVVYLRDLQDVPLPPALHALIPHDPYQARSARVAAANRCRAEFIMRGCTDQAGDEGTLHLLQMGEQLGSLIDLASFAMERVTMTCEHHAKYKDLFRLAVPGLAENRPSVLRGDVIDVYRYHTRKWVRGAVHFVQLDHIVVSMPRGFTASEPVNIRFTISRTQDNMRHRAVDAAPHTFLSVARMREHTSPAANQSRVAAATVFEGGSLTAEQQRALEKVVRTQAPRGVLVWGPPGTGKTTTVVASIAAAYLTYPKARILAVATSNEAADLLVERIAQRLGGNVSRDELLRVNAMQRSAADVPKEVMRFSTPEPAGGFDFPTLDTILEKRIVVTTMMTAGRLYGIGVPDRHFDFVFVDEAGHCTEADLLVALQCAPHAARVLLAGDHKQLGAVVRSPFCIQHQMGRSPLERLIEDPALTDQYVMLTENFRSHDSIVDVVNVVYSDRLRAASTAPPCIPSRCDVSLRIPMHPQREGVLTFPKHHRAAFVHHSGPESREADSPSWMNATEAHMIVGTAVVLWTAHGVNPRDIVILSPYRKQVQKIRQILHNRFLQEFPDKMVLDNRDKYVAPVQVSTVEMFQGREARVILVSCVRNKKDPVLIHEDIRHSIGFVKQEQRANVAMSRAKDLMLVFGNADLLAFDELWGKYLDRMHRNGCVFDTTATPHAHNLLPAWQRSGATSDAYTSDVHHRALAEADGMEAGHEERPFDREH